MSDEKHHEQEQEFVRQAQTGQVGFFAELISAGVNMPVPGWEQSDSGWFDQFWLDRVI